jgi:hypothetical protein
MVLSRSNHQHSDVELSIDQEGLFLLTYVANLLSFVWDIYDRYDFERTAHSATSNGRQPGLSKPTPAASSSASVPTKRPSRTTKVKAEPEDILEIPSATKKKVLSKVHFSHCH